MQIEGFDYDAIGASREVIEAFVCQTYHVKIWHHETDDAVVYSYTRWKLPEGFHGVIDVDSFTTTGPVPSFETAIQVSINYGEIEEDLVFDNLAEPLALLIKHATAHPAEQFEVTRIGCGLAGYIDAEIAPMFLNAPANCSFDTAWQPFLGDERKYWGHVS